MFPRTRSQWLKAFRTAFEYSADMLEQPNASSLAGKTATAASGSEEDGLDEFGRQRYQRQLLEKRRAARAEEKEREDEERAALGDEVRNNNYLFLIENSIPYPFSWKASASSAQTPRRRPRPLLVSGRWRGTV